MSMPNVVHPWSTSAASFITPFTDVIVPSAEPEVTTDVAPIAQALFTAGYQSAAIALAEASPDEMLHGIAAGWRMIVAADAALADQIGRGGGVLIPSLPMREDGSPRFVVQINDADTAVAAIAQEQGDSGVDAELRLFLDEALRDGDRFVDAAPSAGFAALSAASGAAVTSVIVLCEDAEQCAAIEASARWSDVSASITAREGISLDVVPFGAAVEGASTILHAGSAAAVAPLLSTARGALERREIGAVAWRCGRADESGRDAENLQVAAAVLGVFGFIHFALAEGANGTELVPAEAMASNEMIFSIEPGFLARFAS